VGFVVDNVALGQVFSEYLGFPYQFSFHQLLHTHHLSSGAGTIGQLVVDVERGLGLTPPQETKKKVHQSHILRMRVAIAYLYAVRSHAQGRLTVFESWSPTQWVTFAEGKVD
jgi:hypothetical protein